MSSARRVSWEMAVLALAVWGLTLTALAEPPEGKGSKEEARTHFKQGVVLVREGAYRAALVELKRAYELSPDFRVLFNIGQTELQLGEYAAAIDAFEAYLAQGGDRVEPERKTDVETSLAELRKRVATIRVEANGDGVEVAVDGVRAGTTPLLAPLKISVGRHEITGTTADGRSAREVIEVAGGDKRVVRLTLKTGGSESVAAESAAPRPAQPAPDPGLSRRRRVGIVLASVGGAFALGALTTGLLARSAADDHQAALDEPNGSAGKIASTSDDLKTYALTTDVLAATAGALVVTGLVLALIPDAEQNKSIDVGVGFGQLTLRGRF